MRVLTIATGYDSPGINPKTGLPWADATGAFLPEEKAFRALHGGARLEYVTRIPAADRRNLAESSIVAEPGLEVLAVFGHGMTSSLIATGHTLRHVYDLAAAISTAARAAASTQPLTAMLYACSTGTGKIGFADRLADRLAELQISANVYAHTTPGHATWNPRVELSGGPRAGDAIVRPGEPLWKRWRERLRADQAFRLSFWRPGHGLGREAALEAVRAAV